VNTNLLATLLEAVHAGSVPLPVNGESVDEFRFRAAHAGALVALKWQADQLEAQAEARAAAEAQAEDEGRHGDATVTPLAVVPEAAGV
jgi:hypothetical protein